MRCRAAGCDSVGVFHPKDARLQNATVEGGMFPVPSDCCFRVCWLGLLQPIRSQGVPLEASQAASDVWRDAEWASVGSMSGAGSGTGIAMTSCRIDLADDRIRVLSDAVY
jgi:hypothetical protein